VRTKNAIEQYYESLDYALRTSGRVHEFSVTLTDMRVVAGSWQTRIGRGADCPQRKAAVRH